jgi:hypothetical protein
VHLVNLLKEIHRKTPGKVDGFGALVDACYSGAARFGAAQAWVSSLKGTLRFEMLTAAADRPAADGCFSRTLAKILNAGISAVPAEHLLCIHLRPLIEGSCRNQVPQHPSYNPDETLWLARNAARRAGGRNPRRIWSASTRLPDTVEVQRGQRSRKRWRVR